MNKLDPLGQGSSRREDLAQSYEKRTVGYLNDKVIPGQSHRRDGPLCSTSSTGKAILGPSNKKAPDFGMPAGERRPRDYPENHPSFRGS